MPLFRLSRDFIFPPAGLARSDGLLCIGGDLSPGRLVLAYENGIFPWFSDNDPILWWSPDPRLVLFPDKVHVSKSLKKALRKNRFEIRVNTCFESVIRACSQPRDVDTGTWLVDEMIDAYVTLHQKGFAHSIEAWSDGRLAGGLYGISLGRCFFGESMFSKQTDASKIALVTLAAHLTRHRFDLIDCQIASDHLSSMGAVEISRANFLKQIQTSVKKKVSPSLWDSGQSLNRD